MISKNVITDALVFVLLSLFAYFLVSNTLFVGFNIDDDHQFISMKNPHLYNKNFANNWSQLLSYQNTWFKAGRFFPLLTTIIFLKAKIFGSNYLAQHVIVFFSGIITSFFIYKIFRLRQVSTSNAVIGALVFYTGNEYGEIFWRLICGEGPGLLFYVIGLYFTLKYFNKSSAINLWMSVLFLLMAALTKESFILLMPFAFIIPLLGMKTITEVKEFIEKYKKIYLLGLLQFFLLILLVAIMLLNADKMFDYGSPLSLQDTLMNNLFFVVKWFFPFVPLVFFAIFLIVRSNSYKTCLHVALFTCCWIIMHLVIYHKVIISFCMGKYIMPGGLIFIGVLVYSLEYIKSKSKNAYILGLIFIGLVLIRNAKITYINANEYAAKVSSYNKLIDSIIKNNESHVAVYGGIEIYTSLDTHFKIRGYAPSIYSSKVVVSKEQPKSKYQNEGYENSMLATISTVYPTKTLEELGNDSSVQSLIVAEPLETEEIDESVVLRYFPQKHQIATAFNNPKFSDLMKPACWKGELLNSKVTYLVYTKQ